MSALNPIAWLLNLRGNDIAFDPVFYAYVLVSRDQATVWLQQQSLTDEVRNAINELGAQIRDYHNALEEIQEMVAADSAENVLVTDGTVSWAIVDRVGQVIYLPPAFPLCPPRSFPRDPPECFSIDCSQPGTRYRTRSSSSSHRSTLPRRSRTRSRLKGSGGPTYETVLPG